MGGFLHDLAERTVFDSRLLSEQRWRSKGVPAVTIDGAKPCVMVDQMSSLAQSARYLPSIVTDNMCEAAIVGAGYAWPY
jgi:hypothetical protein